jgi:flagellar biosynthesis protein FliR
MAAASLDLFTPGVPETVALLAARVGGLVLVAPVFSSRMIPMTARTALIVLLTIVLFPVARTAVQPAVVTPAAVAGETLIGFVIGLGAALFIGAAETAGDLLSVQIGLSGAALLDPMSNQQSVAIGTFLQLFTVTVLLASNGHLVMLDALAATARRIPLGGAMAMPDGLAEIVSSGGVLFALGARFAAPVICAALIANVALAVLSRAAPQLNILQVAFPVQILVGLAALAISLPAIAKWFGGWELPYDALLTRIYGALGVAGIR